MNSSKFVTPSAGNALGSPPSKLLGSLRSHLLCSEIPEHSAEVSDGDSAFCSSHDFGDCLAAPESTWGWFSLLQRRVPKLPAVCAVWRLQQLPRRAHWGIVGFLTRWEPCLNSRLFPKPGQFSESWRQPVLSHFWKTNIQTKNPNPNQPHITRKNIPIHWKSKYCATEQLRTASVAVWGRVCISGHSLSSVTIPNAYRCQSELDFLTGWTEMLQQF